MTLFFYAVVVVMACNDSHTNCYKLYWTKDILGRCFHHLVSVSVVC